MSKKTIYAIQVLSISLIWVLFTGVTVWVINLIIVAHDLKDAEDASVAISILAIVIFFILASVLTYVFIGLQKGRTKEDSGKTSHE